MVSRTSKEKKIMKKTLSIFAALAVIAALSSCSKESGSAVAGDSPRILTASLSSLVKSTLGADGLSSTWAEGDVVKLTDGTSSQNFTLVGGTPGDNEAQIKNGGAYFTVTIPEGWGETIYGCYPASTFDGISAGAVDINIPSEQEGSFAAANICTAITTGNNLTFQNATALLKITPDSDTKSINIAISGGTPSSITLTPSEAGANYVAVPYGVKFSDLTFTVVKNDDSDDQKTSSQSDEIERNTIYDLGEVADWGLTYNISVTAITLNKTETSIVVGASETLTATISPSNATNKTLTWTSSNTGVATVTSSGVVTAVAAGTATITATATDGSAVAATCTVTVSAPATTGTTNGHDWVQLWSGGLKWATCNVGATNPQDYGNYYAWGETTTKSAYTWATYTYCEDAQNNLTKYCTKDTYGTVDNKSVLELSDDAAYVNWGGSWRMPTKEEQNNLKNNCTWTWTDDYNSTGVKGYIVTGNTTGYTDNSIFLPASGFMGTDNGDTLLQAGQWCYGWSSSISTASQPFNASGFACWSGKVSVSQLNRRYGMPVRAVLPN